MTEYLTDTSVPHKTQHALAQLAERMTRGDARARQWYPLVIRLAARSEPGFRVMAAWTMGQDNKAEEFHRALLPLLNDTDTMVRRNAALALVRFGDASGRAELRALLEPLSIAAPVNGTLKYRVAENEPVSSGTTLAKLASSDETSTDVISPVAGDFRKRPARDGVHVSKGDLIAVVSPDEGQAWEALRALFLIGTAEELPVVERYAHGDESSSDALKRQAGSTAEAIRRRATPK